MSHHTTIATNSIADTLNVPEGYTFGVMVQPDEYGAGKLLQLRSPSIFESSQDQFNAGVLSTIRQHLKLSNFHSLEALQDALQQKDKVTQYLWNLINR